MTQPSEIANIVAEATITTENGDQQTLYLLDDQDALRWYESPYRDGDTEVSGSTLPEAIEAARAAWRGWQIVVRERPFSDLDSLYAAMLSADPRVCDWDGQWRQDLPTFGGGLPDFMLEVWSWDAERLIVGACANELRIVARDDA